MAIPPPPRVPARHLRGLWGGWAALAALALTPGCSMQDTDVRHYQAPKEAAPKSSAAPAEGAQGPSGAAPAAKDLAWTLPDGWSQSEGPRSMRLATFQAVASPSDGGADVKAECTLVALPGTAGGVAANVNRWRGQLGLAPQDAAGIEAAATPLTTGLGEARSWQLLNPDGAESMIAALIPPGPHGGMTHFVKLKAPTSSVRAFAEGFRAFTTSLRPEGAAKPAVKPDAKPAAKPAVQADAKPAAKPAVQPAVKPAVKPAANPAAKAAAKPAAKPDAKPAVKPHAKPAAKPHAAAPTAAPQPTP